MINEYSRTESLFLFIANNVLEKVVDDMLLEFISSPQEEQALLSALEMFHLDKLRERSRCLAWFAYKNADEAERKRLGKPAVGRL